MCYFVSETQRIIINIVNQTVIMYASVVLSTQQSCSGFARSSLCQSQNAHGDASTIIQLLAPTFSSRLHGHGMLFTAMRSQLTNVTEHTTVPHSSWLQGYRITLLQHVAPSAALVLPRRCPHCPATLQASPAQPSTRRRAQRPPARLARPPRGGPQ